MKSKCHQFRNMTILGNLIVDLVCTFIIDKFVISRFAKADFSLDQDAFCAAYINFLNQEDVYLFQERFDGYVFVDNKGNEYVAMVEFAPNQKIAPVKENKKRDQKINTIDDDPDYKKFLEMLENKPEGLDNTVEQTLKEIESKEKENLANQTTPLLQFIKEKGEEKRKKREEQREQVNMQKFHTQDFDNN